MPTSNEYHEGVEACYRLAGEAKTETDRGLFKISGMTAVNFEDSLTGSTQVRAGECRVCCR